MTRKNDDELGGRHWLAAISLQEVEDEPFIPDNSGCPDCNGEGYGCCINADIPMNGTER